MCVRTTQTNRPSGRTTTRRSHEIYERLSPSNSSLGVTHRNMCERMSKRVNRTKPYYDTAMSYDTK